MRRLLAIVAGVTILALIYWRIEVDQLVAVLVRTSLAWLGLGFILFVPIMAITAWRLHSLVPVGGRLRFAEANRLVLAAGALNMALPSRMGDLAKAYFLAERGGITGSLALSLTVFERLCDLLALFAWCLLGLALHPLGGGAFWPLTAAVAIALAGTLALVLTARVARPFFAAAGWLAPARLAPKVAALEEAWRELIAYLRGNRRVLVKVMALSLLNWFLHTLQIWLFILALGAWAPFGASLALTPLALLVGMVPVTFAGIGTRDAALIAFYSPFFAPAIGAALGILCTLRYVVPGIAGLPFLSRYLAAVRARQAGSGGAGGG